MLKIQKFVFNYFQVNTYVVWDEDSLDAVIIDPGCNEESEEEELSLFIRENKITIKYNLNTHLHIDHIMGNRFVKKKFNSLLLMPEKDLPLLKHSVEFAEVNNITYNPSPEPDDLLDNYEEIKIGEYVIKLLFTPGHTPGEFSFLIKSIGVCFTGDVLFKDSIGRTDFWGGDYQRLVQSIRNELLLLNDNTLIMPGHGESAKLEFIKNRNPFVLDF